MVDFKETSSSRGATSTGTYSHNGKTECRPEARSGKQGKTSTVTEDQHRMTNGKPATEAREVSQPLHTPGRNSVLSAPSNTYEREQLDGPIRSKSKHTKGQLNQSKQSSGPERSSQGKVNPDRCYYKPSTDTKTYFVNSQGHLQSREDLRGSSSPMPRANYQTAKKLQSITNQVQLSLMVQKSFELSTPILLTG